MRGLPKCNNGFAYLVTCLDLFSKYAWAVPIKAKTGTTLVEALSKIFKHKRPKRLQKDKGQSFWIDEFRSFSKATVFVHFFTTENDDIKAAVVERFNRTLKEKMWRYFTKTNKLNYIGVLPRLMHSYNYIYHRSIKKAPAHVNDDNQETVWNTLYSTPTHSFPRVAF
jgi:hypothetical protein